MKPTYCDRCGLDAACRYACFEGDQFVFLCRLCKRNHEIEQVVGARGETVIENGVTTVKARVR